MIKLFWNTHNQKSPNSTNKKVREKEEFYSIIQSNDGDINALFKNLKEFVEKD